MSAVTASLCSTLMFVVFVSADQKTITAESGQDVTLTCRAPNKNKITAVKWSRADLVDKHVLLYRDEQFDPANQHPSFKNRVDLQDRQMKDGDVSLILKNVTINDSGTYKCHVFMRETRLWQLSIIYLTVVDPPGPTGGHTEDGGKDGRGKEDGGKEDGGKEDGGKEGRGKEDGGKEGRGKEDGGKDGRGKEEDGGKKEDGGKEGRGMEDGGKEGRGKEDGPAGLKVGVAVSSASLCTAVLLVVGVVGFWIKRRLQSKTLDDPEITQPLTSSQDDSYTDELKIS